MRQASHVRLRGLPVLRFASQTGRCGQRQQFMSLGILLGCCVDHVAITLESFLSVPKALPEHPEGFYGRRLFAAKESPGQRFA
jgi:hypothetical protein